MFPKLESVIYPIAKFGKFDVVMNRAELSEKSDNDWIENSYQPLTSALQDPQFFFKIWTENNIK